MVDQVLITNILTGLSFVVVVTIYIVTSRNNLKIIEARMQVFEAGMEDFKLEMKELNKVLVQQALHHQRLDNMDERMLAQGKRVDRLETVTLRRQLPTDESQSA